MLTGRPALVEAGRRRILPGDRDGEAVRHEQRLPKFVSTVSGQLSCTASQPDRSTVKSPKLVSILPLRRSGVTTGTRQEPKLSSQLRWPLSQRVSCVNFPP